MILMAIMRAKEMRKMEPKEGNKRLSELKLELVKERASISVGASVTNPGRIKEIRRTIARAHTIALEAKRAKAAPKAKQAGKASVESAKSGGKK